MRVRRFITNQHESDSEIYNGNKNDDGKKLELVNKIFMETYLENIQEGMNQKDALQKAKWVAFCFLMQKE